MFASRLRVSPALLAVPLSLCVTVVDCAKEHRLPPATLQKMKREELVLISGSGNKILSQKIASHLGVELAPTSVSFNFDNEVTCHINTSVNGKDVFIIQPCAAPGNHYHIFLCLLLYAHA